MNNLRKLITLGVMTVGALLLLAGCATGASSLPAGEPSSVPAAPTQTPAALPPPQDANPKAALPSPSPEVAVQPTQTPTPAVGLPITTLFFGAQVPVTSTNFVDIPGNLARGEVAPAFRADLMDRGPVTDADWRGAYLLLIPSVAGCGECMVNLYELTQVYSDYQDANVQVAFLSIYPADKPDVWRPLAENFRDLPIQWGTVDPNFVMDYNIVGLGSVLLFDPEGRLAYRSDNALQAAGFEHLLALTKQSAPNITPQPIDKEKNDEQ